MTGTDPQRRLWNLHTTLVTELAAILARPAFDDDAGQPSWPEGVRSITDRVLADLDLALGRLDPGLSSALDGLQHQLMVLRDRPEHTWSPADSLALFTAAEACAAHTARVGGFANLWPHRAPPAS